MTIENKVLGCLHGVAVGDAMGMPTEFLSLEQVVEHYGEVTTFQRTPAWHPLHRLPAGSITDDTEQTVAMAEMIVANEPFDATHVAGALLKWSAAMDLGNLDQMGPSTNYALKRLRNGDDPYQTGLRGNTNGSVMRIAPVGCIHAGEPEAVLDDTISMCAPTHLTDVGVAGAVAVAAGVARALADDATLDSITEAMFAGAKTGAAKAKELIDITTGGRVPWEVIAGQINPALPERMEWAIEVVEKTRGSDATRRDVLARSIGTGVLIIETVPFVLGVMHIAEGDPIRAIRLAANAGGDTDTLASIVGGLCGALTGAGGIPADLVSEVERVNDLDLTSLATKLVARGGCA